MSLQISFLTLLIIFAIIVFADKAITYTNLQLVQKNFPKADALKIEKNPVARLFFDKMGFLGGTISYFFITIVTLFVAYYAITYSLSRIPGIYSYTLWGIMILYGLVIFNNLYFMLKFAKVIP